jgi:hypothetical protein
VPRWADPAKGLGTPPAVKQACALYCAAISIAALQHSRLLA